MLKVLGKSNTHPQLSLMDTHKHTTKKATENTIIHVVRLLLYISTKTHQQIYLSSQIRLQKFIIQPNLYNTIQYSLTPRITLNK